MSAKLRQESVLRPRLQIDTWLRSLSLMLQCYTQLQKHAKKLDHVNIDASLLSPAAEIKVNLLIWKLSELDEVTKKLQRSDTTFRTAQTYFDTVLEAYPDLTECLDPNARIVKPLFFKPIILKKKGRA